MKDPQPTYMRGAILVDGGDLWDEVDAEIRAIHQSNDLDALTAKRSIGEGLRSMGFEDILQI